MSSPISVQPFQLQTPDQQAFFKQRLAAQPLQQATNFSLPSPPASISSDSQLLDFDPADLTFDIGASPESTTLVSPTSLSRGISPVNTATAFSFDPTAAAVNTTEVSPTSANDPTAEALSQHHLERYFHYKTLADQAQAEAVSLSLLTNGTLMPSHEDNAADPLKNNMLALQSQPQNIFNGQGAPGTQGLWNSTLQYHQQQQAAQQALHAQAQAQAHLQAHAAAAAQRTMSMTNYFMPSPPNDATVAAQTTVNTAAAPQQPPSLWSRQSVSTSVSGNSPPFPSTPTYSGAPGMPLAMASIKTTDDMDEEDELSSEGKAPSPSQHLGVQAGGRGYVPGKTPDDPRKRHKCQVCGRGFARAFNLKSHIQTHDPLRPKPHMCPHPMCKRSFSRLHDLERHRQGIHSDGPLVDAKRQGVPPSVVRAQTRMRSRAESGGLI